MLGSGERKGPALRPVLQPFYEEQQRLRIEATPIIATARERLKAAEKHLEHLRTRSAKAKDDAERRTFLEQIDQLATELPIVRRRCLRSSSATARPKNWRWTWPSRAARS